MSTASQAIGVGVEPKETTPSGRYSRHDRNTVHSHTLHSSTVPSSTVQLSTNTMPTVHAYTPSRLSAHAWQNLCIMLTGCAGILSLSNSSTTQESGINSIYELPSNSQLTSIVLSLSFCFGVYAISRVSKYLSSSLENQSLGWHTDLNYRKVCTLPADLKIRIPASQNLHEHTEKILQIVNSNPGDEEFLLAGIANRLNSQGYKDSIFQDFFISSEFGSQSIQTQFQNALSYMSKLRTNKPVIANFKIGSLNIEEAYVFMQAWNGVSSDSGAGVSGLRIMFVTLNDSLNVPSPEHKYAGTRINLPPIESTTRSLQAFARSRPLDLIQS